jgi:dTDP-4-amino-4,6-dideoxygalactose transaminase
MAAVIDLFRPFMSLEAKQRVAEVLTPDADGRIYVGEGARVQEFEQRFGELVGLLSPPPLALNSCTSALELALYLAGVRLGTGVITTPMTCTATNGAILRQHGSIVWADVDPVTGLIDPIDVARKAERINSEMGPSLWRKPQAVVAVDWAGRSCDYNALRRAVPGVPIIQDAAHNVFVDPENHGDYVCWSFGPIKHLSCGGYGGALLPPEAQVERVKKMRWHGLDRTSSADFRCAQDITEVGWKVHMTDDMASVGLANIPHIPRLVARHRENAAWYARALQGAPGVTLPPTDPGASWWLYYLLVDDRASLVAHLASRGIAASPVHRRNDTHPAYHFPNGPLPGVDHIAEHGLAIPVGWWIDDDDRERIAEAILEWAGAHSEQQKELTHA